METIALVIQTVSGVGSLIIAIIVWYNSNNRK